jgi:hypothetical protein
MGISSKQYIRDAARVHKAIQRADDGSRVAMKPLKLQIPARFPQRGLAVFEEEITFLGFCAIILDDTYYMASSICAPLRSEPSMVGSVVVDDIEYIEMQYEPGDKIIASEQLVKIDNILYRIYDEFLAKARIPWYMRYDEIGAIFQSAPKHAGVRIGKTPTVNEIIAATICRDHDDPNVFYRQIIQSLEEIETSPPLYIPLRNVSYGGSGVISKLVGSRFDEGMTSAIVNPSDRVEYTEKHLRT